MSGDGDRDGSLEQGVHVEVSCIKAGLKGPLNFKEVGTRGAVESTFVSGLQISAFLRRRKCQVGCVAEFANGIADAREVLRADQQVNVTGMPQSNVSIGHFREGHAFVGHHLNAESRQVLHDANQFPRKK